MSVKRPFAGPSSPVRARTRWPLIPIYLLALASVLGASTAAGELCQIPDNGTGTVDLPPQGCEYLSPDEVHMIIDGLPPGTTIELDPIHAEFFNVVTEPGGSLGGEIETFDSVLLLEATGTGDLAGFNRSLTIPLHCEVHTGPRTPGDPVQTFPNNMFRLQGMIVADPDFDMLRVTAGTDFGLPSPGQTTLTDLGNGLYNVDSFFDITYQIDFQGAPGSQLDGLSGLTTATLRMETGREYVPTDICEVPDNGTGTIDLPPEGCGYVSPTEFHLIIDGLPPGSTIEIDPLHAQFFNVTQLPGGIHGGEIERFDSFLFVEMNGTGELAGLHRSMEIPLQCEVHTGPRNPGDPIQTFPSEMFRLEGEIFGDPDFDFLHVSAGLDFGLPSPGQTTLTDLGDGLYNVDSFFDITYQIDFQGAPGSQLDGLSGLTTATLRMRTGKEYVLPDVCEVPDNGTGTIDLPPEGCGYISPTDFHLILEGLPPGSTIEIDPLHAQFFNVTQEPGGVYGGEIERFDSFLSVEMNGSGELAGFHRSMDIPLQCEVHTGPRNPGDPVQTFPNEMFRLEGEIFGDPDFDFLHVSAGLDFGLPSPGQTTLTDLGNGLYNVDSFFDITYQIDFQGAPGSQLEGMAGTTTATVRMRAGQPVEPPNSCVVADNGTGTVNLPPEGCAYISPDELHMIIEGLPPGTTIELDPIHDRFFNVDAFPGGSLGGEIEIFDSFLSVELAGTGELEGFQRSLEIPLHCEVHTGPRTPGDSIQTFPNDMFRLQGEILGDADFDFLGVTGGTDFGLPGPGQTTLTDLGNGLYNVDSFFDISYSIDFVGAPGSQLEGMSGTTIGTVRMETGVSIALGIDAVPDADQRSRLLYPLPNPFNPTIRLPFVLGHRGHAEIKIYDVSGRALRSLVNRELSAGQHEVIWDGRDNEGRLLPSGTYFYELRVDGEMVDTRKAIMLK